MRSIVCAVAMVGLCLAAPTSRAQVLTIGSAQQFLRTIAEQGALDLRFRDEIQGSEKYRNLTSIDPCVTRGDIIFTSFTLRDQAIYIWGAVESVEVAGDEVIVTTRLGVVPDVTDVYKTSDSALAARLGSAMEFLRRACV